MFFHPKQLATLLLTVTSIVGSAVAAVPTTPVKLNYYNYQNKVFSGQIYVSVQTFGFINTQTVHIFNITLIISRFKILPTPRSSVSFGLMLAIPGVDPLPLLHTTKVSLAPAMSTGTSTLPLDLLAFPSSIFRLGACSNWIFSADLYTLCTNTDPSIKWMATRTMTIMVALEITMVSRWCK